MNIPENWKGFRAYLDALAAKGEMPPRWLDSYALDRLRPKEKGPNGRALCRWCWTEVPPRRISWCGEECVTASGIRSSASIVQWHVRNRDAGICARCGADALKASRIINRLRWYAPKALEHGWTSRSVKIRDAYEAFREDGYAASGLILAAWGRRGGRHDAPMELWEADHIVPVIRGGGCCGLENYRTLCVPCHREATAELAGVRAAERRPQRALPLDEATA
jgi:5-methylcytosine-specific restriction protein A